MTIGIYKLNFTGTDKVYIGQSKNIENRLQQHINTFKRGKLAKKLSEGFINFGMPTIELVCECVEEELNSTENEAIEIFDTVNNGFNTLSRAEHMPNNPQKGEEHYSSKYSNEDIEKVFNLLIEKGVPLTRISEDTQVPLGIIKEISSLRTHKWLKQKYPEKYATLVKLKGTRCSLSNTGKGYPEIKSPTGIVYNIENICRFAKEHNLTYQHLGGVLRGTNKTHKGWRLADGS